MNCLMREVQASDRVFRICQQKSVFTHLPAVPPTHIMTSSMGTLTALRGNLMLKDGVVTPESAADKDIIQSVGL